MLNFGASVSDWQDKANYAEDKADNEFAKIREIRCEGIEDVQTAMAAMAAFAVGSKCVKFLYHATINLNPGERLTRKQWMEAIDRLERKLGLTGHYRIAFEHIKRNRQHYHIYWSRIPPKGGAAVNMGNDYFAHQNVAKELEMEFCLKPAPRKDKNKPSTKKQEIDDRNSRRRINPDFVTLEVTRLFNDSKTTKAFIAGLAKSGYILSRGKNGSYVIVDSQSGYHGLMRRIEGAKIKDLREKFPELDGMILPGLSSVLKNMRPASKQEFKRAARIFAKAQRRYVQRIRNQIVSSPKPIGRLRPGLSLLALIAAIRGCIARGGRNYYPSQIKRRRRKRRKRDENTPDFDPFFKTPEMQSAELLAWAWETHNIPVLAQYGIHFPPDTPEL